MKHIDHEIIKTDLINSVLEHERLRLNKLMSAIQDVHRMSHDSRGFILDGKAITNGDAHAIRDKNKKYLAEEYRDEARRIVSLTTKLHADGQRLRNFCGVLSTNCKSFQAYRDVLPDLVVGYMECPEIKALSRTRQEGYIFESSPIKQKLFHDITELMFHYLANRLVY